MSDKVYKILLDRNKQTAESFLSVLEKIVSRMDEEERQEWYLIIIALTEKGWHSWHCALRYLELSVLSLEKSGSSTLIDQGKFALKLLKLSQQSTEAYLNGVQFALERGRLEHITNIENCGLSLKQSYPQASNLLTAYYNAAFQFEKDIEALKTWCETIVVLAELNRQAVFEFVGLTSKHQNIDWAFASKLYLLSPLLGRSYIAFYEEFYGGLFPELEDEVEVKSIEEKFRVLLDQTAIFNPKVNWLQSLKLKNLNAKSLALMINLSEDLKDPFLVLALLEAINSLPLNRIDPLRTWVSEGLKLSRRNHRAGIAFLKLESNQGQQSLDSILGRLRFAEHKRTLQIYAEGMSQMPFSITESPSDLVYCKERTMYVPELISRYKSYSENFIWVKLAINHQLASHEFGTYDYRYLRSSSPFTSLFQSFDDPRLASILFRILEAGRLDWRMGHEYRGLNFLLNKVKLDVVRSMDLDFQVSVNFISLVTLDAIQKTDKLSSEQNLIFDSIQMLKDKSASVFSTAKALTECYSYFTLKLTSSEIPFVHYRGKLDLSSFFSVLKFEVFPEDRLSEELDSEKSGPPAEGDVSELVQGDAPEAEGIELLDSSAEPSEISTQALGQEPTEKRGRASSQQDDKSYYYDEWDYQIGDYRSAWCTLYEMKAKEENREYVTKTLLDLARVSRQVQKQLNKIRPELHQKVKGLVDGEELDMDRAIEAYVDRRSGFSPSDRIYVQKQKQLRDVAALFLLDMSASTDDVLSTDGQGSADTKIIDLEKQAVILMAEGLEKLGDRYSICGFSGYGRDKVEYLVCKSFDESYDKVTKARIGGIKPCRSTRMGPAIRHASKMLKETDAKVKALIILSDGYPQDYDYGSDRTSKIYGLRDTAKALDEASGLGVTSFCLTVDPSGHDYLKEMCPPRKYMVMQDISQLPTELSKIYQSLTSA